MGSAVIIFPPEAFDQIRVEKEGQITDPGLLERFAADPSELLEVALGFARTGQVGTALKLVQAVREFDPGNRHLDQIERIILTHNVPKYHLPMVCDEERNRAYAQAIERAAPRSSHALDLGTGSGLLAMLAARAGAERVSACEENPVLAYTAEQIIAENGLSERIRVHGRRSADLDAEEHLGGRVDLIISETFGHDLVGEGALQSISDAVLRLGTSTVRVVPGQASVMVALARLDRALLPPYAGDVCGFDLTLLNRHRQDFVRIDVDDPALALASDGAALFQFDLGTGKYDRFGTTVVTADGGVADGIVQWVRLQLDENTSYENRPAAGRTSHWQAVFWPFERRTLAQGAQFTICGLRHESGLRIWEGR